MPWKNKEAMHEYNLRYNREHREKCNQAQRRYEIRQREQLRTRVFNKTSGKCHLCGVILDSGWHIDHRIPKSKGGTDAFDNLWPSCVKCNCAATNHYETDPGATDFPFGHNIVKGEQ